MSLTLYVLMRSVMVQRKSLIHFNSAIDPIERTSLSSKKDREKDRIKISIKR